MAETKNRWVVLLRGVNVGGVAVKNARLTELFEAAGFEAVRPVLASGNAAFDAPAAESGPELAARIATVLSEGFGRDIPFVLESQERLRRVAEAYPFEREDAVSHPYVVFSSDPEAIASVLEAAEALPLDIESVSGGDGVVYWRVPKGSTLETPFAKVLAGRALAPRLTTRNLRTVEKLLSV